ncbi:MAG: hypothetical protein HYV95_10150 [Opitutae bacterium]|nr:hypothetical protein [Opitutae bacterium]
MITLRQLLAAVGCFIGLLYLLATFASPASKPAPAAIIAHATPRPDLVTRAQQAAAEQHLASARLTTLERTKRQLDRRQTAADQMAAYRQRHLDAHRTEWSNLILRHWSQYQNLHAAAGRSPALETPCTICDDSFLKFCLICDGHNDGKCPECHGSGHLPGGDICPACSDTGKCFMCAGTGKMPCPFCDQRGMVYFDHAPPSFVPIPL